MKKKEYADKTGVERSIERWEGEGGEVLPTALRILERAAIEKQENKADEEQHTCGASGNSFEKEEFQSSAAIASKGGGDRETAFVKSST